MGHVKLLSALLIFNLPLFSIAASVGCNVVSSTSVWTTEYDGNYTGKADIRLSENNGEMQIIVSNIFLNTTNENKNYNKSVCIFDAITSIKFCTYNLTDPIYFSVENTTTVYLWGYYGDYSMGFTVFNNVIDENSFNPASGTLYNKNESCVMENEKSYRVSQKQCCTSFTSISEEAPPNSPKCVKFTSRATIYNVTDNYSVFATSNMFYNMTHNIITAKGNVNGPDRFTVSYAINANNLVFSDTRPTLNYTLNLPTGDNKLIFTVNLENNRNDHIQFFGRLIIRNGITMMEEGMPFTPTNDCFYNNYPYEENQIAHHEFCCAQFVDI